MLRMMTHKIHIGECRFKIFCESSAVVFRLVCSAIPFLNFYSAPGREVTCIITGQCQCQIGAGSP